MKSFFLLSTSLLLAAIPHTSAAPTAWNAVSARWFKGGDKAAPVAVPRAVVTDGTDDDPDDDYLVILADHETRTLDEVMNEMGCNKTDLHHTINGVSIRGFTMKMKKSQGVSMFSLPNVASVEKNIKMKLAVMPRETPAKRQVMPRSLVKGRKNAMKFEVKKRQDQKTYLEQSSAPWNLQRISSEDTVDTNGRADTDLTYRYRFEATSGSGVDVYMLDTGINVGHTDFGGRATMVSTVSGADDIDREGHGTHTAGTVGARTFGVAKNVNLIGLKVFDNEGNGSLLDSIDAIEKVTQMHNTRINDPGFMGSVISMSLGGQGPSPGMELAIAAAIKAGIHFSVAAGNENQDACNTTPAGISATQDIITVGATDIDDNRASFSNFGPCVDIHAPGVQITSTFINTANPKLPFNGNSVLQGTSMACPAVTGMIAAELVQNPDLKLNPAGMKKLILSKAINGVIKSASDVPTNGMVLLNNGFPGNPSSF